MKTQTNEPEQAPANPTGSKRLGLQTLLNGVVFIPAVIIPVAAIAVLGTLGFIGLRVVNNGGFMPKPTSLDTYSCAAFVKPFQLAFRHGMDVVQLRSGDVAVWGDILNGKITWEEPGKVQLALGFTADVLVSQFIDNDIELLGIVAIGQQSQFQLLLVLLKKAPKQVVS